MSNVAYIYGAPSQRTLEDTSCCVCGIIFAVPAEFLAERRKNKNENLYCPNGHTLSFRESEADRLKRQLEAEKSARERAEREAQDERQRAKRLDTKAKKLAATIKRNEKRVGNGVCPCCNRTFQQLARHMATKHPHYPGEAQ